MLITYLVNWQVTPGHTGQVALNSSGMHVSLMKYVLLVCGLRQPHGTATGAVVVNAVDNDVTLKWKLQV